MDVALDVVRQKHDDLDQLQDYFQAIEKDIVANIRRLGTVNHDENEDDQTPAEWFRRYKVNVIIDNQANSQAPVVAEYDPQLSRLVGRVEHEARYGGAVVTDFTLLRAGALHSANGGYPTGTPSPAPAVKKHIYGSIDLDAFQAKKQFADLVDEVVQQFTVRQGVRVKITIEIQADSDAGFDDGLQRAVKENCNVLRFKNAEFEAGD